MSDHVAPAEFRREFIALIIPVLNEKENILAVIDQVRPLQHDYEIIVVDGGSSDGTPEIVASLGDDRIKVLPNTERIQAAGVNLAVSIADLRAHFFIRVDAHCKYPEGWTDRIVRHLVETGATSVVVAMNTSSVVDGGVQEAIAFAQNSRLGNGGAAHRNEQRESKFVDHGHHAGFQRSFFVEHGGYDVAFAVNEDGEYDLRTTASGAKIWLAADAGITYFPRKTLNLLARQYFRYGKGRCSTVIKHGVRPKPRQLIPVAITMSAFGGILLQFLNSFFLAPFALYLVAAFLYTYRVTPVEKGARFAINVFSAAVVMHVAWGAGFLYRLSEYILSRTSGSAAL